MSSSSTLSFPSAIARIQCGESVSDITNHFFSQLTDDEKLHLLDGDDPFYPALAAETALGYNNSAYVFGAIPRLSLPGIRFTDGPRGVTVITGKPATVFPVSTARGATWDTDLEEAVGIAIGKEVRVKGCNLYGGVCINLPRHPAWGRIQETYSEDPVLLGKFGAALTRGIQKNVMACVKHFALNSMENSRFRINVKCEDEALHEVYLPHFKTVVEEGVWGVMSAYNSVNGEWAGQNKTLLTKILRDTWGYKGFVISDFVFGTRDAAKSVLNGMDIEAPWRQVRARDLPGAMERREVMMEDVEKIGRRVIGSQLAHAASIDPQMPDEGVVFCKEHRELSRTIAQKSIVLLQNNKVEGTPLLPLDKSKLSTVAVIGRLANTANIGDHSSSNIRNPEVTSPYAGLKATLRSSNIILDDSDTISSAIAAAKSAGTVILVVGYNANDEGEYMVPSMSQNPDLPALFPPSDGSPEAKAIIAKLTANIEKSKNKTEIIEATALRIGKGGDRTSLHLRRLDVEIINAVIAVNPRTIVTIITAGAVITESWRHTIPAVLISWYSGCEGGYALADVLLGNVDAGGRLPYSIPKTEADLPKFDIDAKEEVVYDKWFGQRLLDKKGVEAAFPIGFGLSYTSFKFSSLEIGNSTDEAVEISVKVTNTGRRVGKTVVQVYGKQVVSQKEFPVRVLLGFKPVDLKAGESKVVRVAASTQPLKRWSNGQFVLASKKVIFEVASYAGDKQALVQEVLLAGVNSNL